MLMPDARQNVFIVTGLLHHLKSHFCVRKDTYGQFELPAILTYRMKLPAIDFSSAPPAEEDLFEFGATAL